MNKKVERLEFHEVPDTRKCLRCDQTFHPVSKFNFICPPCIYIINNSVGEYGVALRLRNKDGDVN